MGINELIDKLENLVKTGKAPLLNKDQVVLEVSDLYEIIDLLRNNIPREIQDAMWIKREEEKIPHSAQEEQERIIHDAKERAMSMVEEHEIYLQAKDYGDGLVEEARRQAHEITEGAFMYAHDIMEKLENQLTVYYEVVQEGRDEIQNSLHAMQNAGYQAPLQAGGHEEN